nr:hypothetical protein Iba_chr12bCG3320 [Ipomoea batatas]
MEEVFISGTNVADNCTSHKKKKGSNTMTTTVVPPLMDVEMVGPTMIRLRNPSMREGTTGEGPPLAIAMNMHTSNLWVASKRTEILWSVIKTGNIRRGPAFFGYGNGQMLLFL